MAESSLGALRCSSWVHAHRHLIHAWQPGRVWFIPSQESMLSSGIQCSPLNYCSHCPLESIVQFTRGCLQSLDPSSRNTLAQWLSELPAEILGARSVRPVQRWLSEVAHRQHPPSTHVSVAVGNTNLE